MWDADDYRYMADALRLAESGLCSTTPNPRVGCVIVNDGIVAGTGWHRRAGEAHAEVLALREAGDRARNATVYVTLEPCSHFGRTPPCADALIAAGVKRVVAAMQDPNPQVAGKGLARLRAAGIDVSSGLLEEQAVQLNIGFIQRMRHGRPWIRIKTASSLDGKIALANGESKWITGAAARADVQRWRARSCAVMTGIGTILADDPQLTVRDIETSRQPLRIIVDSRLQTPADARILQTAGVIIAYAHGDSERQRQLTDAGAELLQLPAQEGRVNLTALMALLAQRGINEILTEAGAGLNTGLIAAGLADEWLMYLAPTLLGTSSLDLFSLAAPATMEQRQSLRITDLRQIGSDLRITAHLLPQ
ncbi:MAG TPA: bifunctional diaminohydroxyphosphoribosylaminopyrimidine deaminase/5-amino-6-(5-phosphoribosylamino)uracil reductase RibD [Burkholderiales bacterium]|nr:bifunctional diaminohydroxyphosphoribosylaminopyrimidine deaminase/5-amino-6-(5-phosphoribosylamino)uracil reductase RibD [Burkholderiales bacterium]